MVMRRRSPSLDHLQIGGKLDEKVLGSLGVCVLLFADDPDLSIPLSLPSNEESFSSDDSSLMNIFGSCDVIEADMEGV